MKILNRNISSLRMERHCPQLVPNKKSATVFEQNCRHILILVLFFTSVQQTVEFRASSAVAGSKNSLAVRLSHWKALPSDEKVDSDLHFFFCRKLHMGDNRNIADGISIRFPRVTRIRDDKDWKTANDLPHLRVSYTW